MHGETTKKYVGRLSWDYPNLIQIRKTFLALYVKI